MINTIDVMTFAQFTGISERDLFVLKKFYVPSVKKTKAEWFDLLKNDFDIPKYIPEIVIPTIEASKIELNPNNVVSEKASVVNQPEVILAEEKTPAVYEESKTKDK